MRTLLNFYTLTIFAVFHLAGCTTSMQLAPVGEGKISNVDERNYVIGTVRTAYVGEKIVSRKAYDTYVQSNYMESTNSFSLTGGLGTVAVALHGSRGDKFKIIGTNEKGNFTVSIPGSHLTFGITKDGHWDGTIASPSFWTSPVGGGSGYEIKPQSTKFSPVASATPISDSGYINHELIYTGLGANGIHLLYREYTFKNMARSAYSQDLVYPSDSQFIRFRSYKIKVIDKSSSEIKYIVEAE